MKKIGLTGGIACGKSTVSARLRDQGAPVIDADVLAREAVQKGMPGLALIVSAFGSEMLNEEGELNRARLGQTIFNDPAAREILEAILHPMIRGCFEIRCAEHEKYGTPALVYDAALLFESGSYRDMDAIIVVTIPPEIQLQRLIARNHLNRQEALCRIAAQMAITEKLQRANFIIDNGGTLAETHAQTDAIWMRISEKFAF